MTVGWSTAPIGSVCSVIAGQSPPGDAYNDQGDGLPFYQGKKEFTDRYLAAPSVWTTHVTKRAAAGDFLMSVRAPVGPINEACEEICIGRGLAAIRTGGDIHRDYLWYALSWLQPEIAGSDGAVFPSINKSQIEAIEIPFPPLDEQKRIVAVLDQTFAALDRVRANAEANLADADELLERASARVIEGKAGGALRSLRLSEVTSRLTNGYVGPTRDIYRDDGVPYLLARHVRNGSLRFDGRTYVSSEFNQKHRKSTLKQGDVLLVQSGHIGHCAVVPKEHHGHNCHAMIVMTPKEDLISGKYLSAAFNTPLFQVEFQRIRTGSTVPHLTCTMVRELVIKVPERAQQARIVSDLEALSADMSAVRLRYTVELEDLAHLRSAMLQAAFSGQLT